MDEAATGSAATGRTATGEVPAVRAAEGTAVVRDMAVMMLRLVVAAMVSTVDSGCEQVGDQASWRRRRHAASVSKPAA
ncbi:hypothetical protein Aau02nite_92070 [Amorphoplanes auranticolor]|uniref:Uncharacterized protein n=1 Tax=Actinoplanes auranticolor TaxID=47988 RepID=A0A919T0K1_9ACTN|nr:hypothetical protein Aau02nite_92070 [Actinoplanes auranticolor]